MLRSVGLARDLKAGSREAPILFGFFHIGRMLPSEQGRSTREWVPAVSPQFAPHLTRAFGRTHYRFVIRRNANVGVALTALTGDALSPHNDCSYVPVDEPQQASIAHSNLLGFSSTPISSLD